MNHSCRLENEVVELGIPSQVQTDGNTTLPLIKDCVWEKSDGFQGGQTLGPRSSPGEVWKHRAGSDHPGCLLKALCSWVQGWTYGIRTCQGQEFAFLISSRSVFNVHSVLKPHSPYMCRACLLDHLCFSLGPPSWFLLTAPPLSPAPPPSL